MLLLFVNKTPLRDIGGGRQSLTSFVQLTTTFSTTRRRELRFAPATTLVLSQAFIYTAKPLITVFSNAREEASMDKCVLFWWGGEKSPFCL